MKKILELYKFINILSLDVAAGAVICASFFARVMNIEILPQGLISLGLTVWIIYTADHLLDAKKLKQEASTRRHRFHQQHFKILLLLLVAAVFLDVTQIYFIRSIVFVAGLSLAFFVGIYFLIQQRIGSFKELLGTLLYTGGVLLVPLSIKHQLSSSVILLIIQFSIIVWINLLLFSWIDKPRDEKDKHHSFATTFGFIVTRRILLLLFSIAAVLIVVQLVMFPINTLAAWILSLMTMFLLLIFLKKDFFEAEDRYRLLGDAVFLLPIIYILIE
jgi:4-hydroxybenzoate polyprenyltransferase